MAEFAFPAATFEVVILHRTLDGLFALARQKACSLDLGAFLSGVSRVLSAGGALVGCVDNRYSFEGICRLSKRLLRTDRGVSYGINPAPTFTVGTCHASLAQAGFKQIRLFSAVPNSESPVKLISTERGWSRSAARRHADALRPLVQHRGYLAWRVLGELGISHHFGNSIYFSCRKAC
jgi:hypothetical protein